MATPSRHGEDSRRVGLSSRRSPPRNISPSVTDHQHAASTDPQSVSSDLQSISTDPHSASSDPRSASSDPQSASSDPRSASSHSSSSASVSSAESSLSQEGFDVDLFVDRDLKYICPICMMVLRDPQQTQCGHRFCAACIRKWIRQKRHPQCPVCQDPCSESPDRLFPDNFAKREVMSLVVKCSNHKAGCLKQMELRNLEKHEAECVFGPVDCPNGCDQVIPRNKLKEHIKNTCSHRLVNCKHCNKQIQNAQIKNHYEDCPEKVVDCEFCAVRCSRSKMVSHVKTTCSNAPIDCWYGRYGCPNKQMRRSQEHAHLQEAVVGHLHLVSKYLDAINPPGSTKFYDVTRSAPIISTLASVTSPLTDPGFCSDYSGTSTVYSIAPSHYPTVLATEHEASELMSPIYPIVPGQWKHPMSVPSSPHGSHQLMSPHDQRRPLTFPLIMESQKKSEEELKTNISKLQTTIDSQRQVIDQQNTRIRQLELQQRDNEGRWCNGTYIWKIPEYSRKKREVVEMSPVVHHSPGFYTSTYGYKMCIRVNLNGVESGTGTHLSLFVHLMRGDYDEILCWPFHGRIMLSVLDQRDNGDKKRDITETLIAKPGLNAFLKPTQKRNHKGFGYIEFAPLSYVENGDYIRNDTMIVKAVVRPDD